MKIKTINKNTYATSPGSIFICKEKLRNLRPELYGFQGWIKGIREKVLYGFTEIRRIEEHIYYGDSQPAMVISKKPLLIVAYSEDLDCVVPLRFPDDYAELYNLEEKSRLISINTYMSGPELQKDITLGPNNNECWKGYCPIIGEFITNDMNILTEKKDAITEEMWDYVYKLGMEYREKYPDLSRDGRPLFSGIPSI